MAGHNSQFQWELGSDERFVGGKEFDAMDGEKGWKD